MSAWVAGRTIKWVRVCVAIETNCLSACHARNLQSTSYSFQYNPEAVYWSRHCCLSPRACNQLAAPGHRGAWTPTAYRQLLYATPVDTNCPPAGIEK